MMSDALSATENCVLAVVRATTSPAESANTATTKAKYRITEYPFFNIITVQRYKTEERRETKDESFFSVESGGFERRQTDNARVES
jgi:hypothetical protein